MPNSLEDGGPAIALRGVSLTYPNGHMALRGVSLTVAEGEIVALLGRSGAGKSTLLRTINALQPATAGEVRVHGVDLGTLTPRELAEVRRRIGFVWQEFNVVKRLSAFTNVLTGRLGYRRGYGRWLPFFDRGERRIALRSLERVDMLHRATARADRLSGGEKQRVAIARALAQEPLVLLADEPVASLDAELAWQVMRTLVGVAREERAPTIIALHDVALARAFADRIVALAEGRVVFDGPPASLEEAHLDAIYRTERGEVSRPLAPA